jgi:hypothetical protein
MSPPFNLSLAPGFPLAFMVHVVPSLCGQDSSIADAALWTDTCVNDLHMPEGQYLLADAGFGTCDALLNPYCGVRYHLREWWQANLKYLNCLHHFMPS